MRAALCQQRVYNYQLRGWTREVSLTLWLWGSRELGAGGQGGMSLARAGGQGTLSYP